MFRESSPVANPSLFPRFQLVGRLPELSDFGCCLDRTELEGLKAGTNSRCAWTSVLIWKSKISYRKNGHIQL